MVQTKKAKNLILVSLILIALIFTIYKFSSNESQNNRSSTSDKQHLSVIRIAVPDISAGTESSSGIAIIDYIQLHQLMEKEFEKDHVKIEWHYFKGAGPAINEALANKQLDFAFLGDFAAIIGKANNLDTRLILATLRHTKGYLAVQPNQGYTDLEALRKKRIAVWQGTAGQLAFNQFIQEQGFTEKDFRIINLDPMAAQAALLAKRIDASWSSIDMLALQQRGLVEIHLSSEQSPTNAGSIEAGLIVRNELVKHHPEVVQRFVKVMLQGSYWVAQPENRDAAIKLIATKTNFPIELLQAGFENQAFKNIYSPLLDDTFIQHFKSGTNLAYESKLIRQKFDVDAWIEPIFVNQGIKQLNYEGTW
ncbi:ABC transporter substrate-binding protein [Acinetobacter puyangensis]|uniref:ABC transporter substrate-binding protein n=1 Tax=Acinetobacter puyangensis TaxID=1096779 RepID=UPI003A4DF387